MSYEIISRGDMFFGQVFDVYDGVYWIGSIVQAKEPSGWTASTPSGIWPKSMPFNEREQSLAINWLKTKGERVHKRDRCRYEYRG